MRRTALVVLALAALAGATRLVAVDARVPARWWSPGEGTRLPAYATYPNAWGELGILNTNGPVETKGHPFFEPIGQNGRACVSCHQPASGMSISVAAIQERWQVTKGKDPIFAAVDGMNTRNSPRSSSSECDFGSSGGRSGQFIPSTAAKIGSFPLVACQRS